MVRLYRTRALGALQTGRLARDAGDIDGSCIRWTLLGLCQWHKFRGKCSEDSYDSRLASRFCWGERGIDAAERRWTLLDLCQWHNFRTVRRLMFPASRTVTLRRGFDEGEATSSVRLDHARRCWIYATGINVLRYVRRMRSCVVAMRFWRRLARAWARKILLP